MGRYALLSEPLFDQYYAALDERLMDKGVSVRKAIVKILRDALLTHPNYHHRADICRKLVHRASAPKEEDSIKDLIHQTFQRLWFDSEAASKFSTSAGASAIDVTSEALENLPAGWRTEVVSTGAEGGPAAISAVADDVSSQLVQYISPRFGSPLS